MDPSGNTGNLKPFSSFTLSVPEERQPMSEVVLANASLL
jgi:hypothetical protein